MHVRHLDTHLRHGNIPRLLELPGNQRHQFLQRPRRFLHKSLSDCSTPIFTQFATTLTQRQRIKHETKGALLCSCQMCHYHSIDRFGNAIVGCQRSAFRSCTFEPALSRLAGASLESLLQQRGQARWPARWQGRSGQAFPR